MADTSTKNYGWIKPEVGGSPAIWGAKLNNGLDAIDTQVATVASQVGSGITDAPLDNNLYGRTNGNWTVVPPPTGVTEAPTTSVTFGRNNAQWVPLPPFLVDAPNNGTQYGRQSGNWTPIAASVSEAPHDGQLYGRTNATWVVVASGGSGGISDAPNDGTTYARKVTSGAGAWTHLAHTDISDWAATLANYYPTSNPSGYQTASQVTTAIASAVPAPSATTPLADGTAAIGTATTYARADHVHPIGAVAKWTLIATQPSASASSVIFTNIPQTYGDLMIVGNTTAGSASGTAMAMSTDGVTYSSSPWGVTQSNSASGSFVIAFRGYSNNNGSLTSNYSTGATFPASPSLGSATTTSAISVHTGGCTAIKFTIIAGGFWTAASGTISLYGR